MPRASAEYTALSPRPRAAAPWLPRPPNEARPRTVPFFFSAPWTERIPCGAVATGRRWLMADDRGRRDFLGLLGVGGVTFASALWGCGGEGAAASTAARSPAAPAPAAAKDFFFLQLSDTHW